MGPNLDRIVAQVYMAKHPQLVLFQMAEPELTVAHRNQDTPSVVQKFVDRIELEYVLEERKVVVVPRGSNDHGR